jgi:hypothetical protein
MRRSPPSENQGSPATNPSSKAQSPDPTTLPPQVARASHLPANSSVPMACAHAMNMTTMHAHVGPALNSVVVPGGMYPNSNPAGTMVTGMPGGALINGNPGYGTAGMSIGAAGGKASPNGSSDSRGVLGAERGDDACVDADKVSLNLTGQGATVCLSVCLFVLSIHMTGQGAHERMRACFRVSLQLFLDVTHTFTCRCKHVCTHIHASRCLCNSFWT